MNGNDTGRSITTKANQVFDIKPLFDASFTKVSFEMIKSGEYKKEDLAEKYMDLL
jgi:hypothetical protein